MTLHSCKLEAAPSEETFPSCLHVCGEMGQLKLHPAPSKGEFKVASDTGSFFMHPISSLDNPTVTLMPEVLSDRKEDKELCARRITAEVLMDLVTVWRSPC